MTSYTLSILFFALKPTVMKLFSFETVIIQFDLEMKVKVKYPD
jgi:hypothetical protein